MKYNYGTTEASSSATLEQDIDALQNRNKKLSKISKKWEKNNIIESAIKLLNFMRRKK